MRLIFDKRARFLYITSLLEMLHLDTFTTVLMYSSEKFCRGHFCPKMKKQFFLKFYHSYEKRSVAVF